MIVGADFETWPIFQRPNYPPDPVGLALLEPGRAPFYGHWGHFDRPNVSEDEARQHLLNLWQDPAVIFAFHNAKFDLSVAYERWELPELPWHRFHDTMILSFLYDPYAPSFGLKPLANALLNMPADERDDVAGYVQENKRMLEAWWESGPAKQYGPLKVSKGKEGAWIFAVPGEIVSPYACGDVVRTIGLLNFYLPRIEQLGMSAAYDRERRLLPILLRNERQGMRVDLEPLERDIEAYGKAFDYVEDQLRFVLRASGLNFDADQDVAAILIERNIVPEHSFSRTKASKVHPNGLLRMSKEELLPELFVGSTPQGVSGRDIASALGYRNRLATCLNTFMRPWQRQASVNRGYITTNWSQTRDFGGGAKTGRATTSNHNFLNISKDFNGRDDQYVHPAFLGVPELPLCRTYVLPDADEVFLHRDFSGQELRIFAEGEQGSLFDAYQENPRLDPHAMVGAQLMEVAKREIERTRVKTLNFQGIYGGGVPALQKKLRVSMAEAKELKRFHDQALPGRRLMHEEITRIARRGDPIRTIGGRLYWPTPPENGRETFYKLLNYWVQGSAADLTKQALVDWDEAMRSGQFEPWVAPARFLVTVYDEINLSSPKDCARENMALLRRVMEAPRLRTPMLSDGKWGLAWGKLEKYKDD